MLKGVPMNYHETLDRPLHARQNGEPVDQVVGSQATLREELEEVSANCPSCMEPLIVDVTECGHCGVVVENFLNYQVKRDLSLSHAGSSHLKSEEIVGLLADWKKLESVFTDYSLHEAFIMNCLRKEALPLAIHQYTLRRQKLPNDEVSDVMLERCQALFLAQQGIPENDARDLPLMPYYRLFHHSMLFAVVVGLWLIYAGVTQPDLFISIGGGILTATGLLVSAWMRREGLVS